MPPLRVLYDISGIGLGQVSPEARAGSFRVDRHVVDALNASADCELMACANHSSLAWQGAAEYLRERPHLARVPLLRPDEGWLLGALRGVMVAAHRRLKISRGGRALPPLVRAGGSMVDARVHRPVVDATPPADIFHSTTTPLPALSPRQRSPRRFLTIFDLRASHGDATAAEIDYEQALLGSLREGDHVITSSEATKRALCDRGIASARVAVVPLAADRAVFRPDAGEDPAAVRDRLGLPAGPFVLMPNTLRPRKNVLRACEAFAALIQQEAMGELSLVLVGGPAASATAAAIVERLPALRGRATATGHVSDSDLAALYRAATVFVYPSLYEGFGLPPLEAMQCGCPIVTANTSSLPEVVGDAALTVDPLDRDALASAILTLCSDAALRDTFRRRGLARAQQFSWQRTTELLLAAYRPGP